ncbi:MAG: nuclear transport factor 2 family protein [Solirubrobacterales bacterium]
MAETNTKIYRRMLAVFNERGLEGAVEFFDEDVEVYDPDLPEGTRIRGHDAVLRTFGEMLDAFEEMKVEDFEVIPAGDRVVALVHTAGYGQGRYGLMDVELRDAHVMTFRNGKITYWRLYMDQAEALADAGLDPSRAWHRRKPPEPAA